MREGLYTFSLSLSLSLSHTHPHTLTHTHAFYLNPYLIETQLSFEARHWNLLFLPQKDSQFLLNVSLYTNKWKLIICFAGGSSGLVVIGGDSCSEGCGFKSQHRLLDGYFSQIDVCLKIPKIKNKNTEYKQ